MSGERRTCPRGCGFYEYSMSCTNTHMSRGDHASARAPGQCPDNTYGGEPCLLHDGHSGTCRRPLAPANAAPKPPAKESSIYVIGSMRNPRVPVVAKALRDLGYDVFDDWYSVGPEADDKWQEYEKARGRTYREALGGHHARHVFELDKRHLDRCTAAVLVAPAGKSAHTELGYMIGTGKQAYVLLDGEPERFDIMTLFATGILTSIEELSLLTLVLP